MSRLSLLSAAVLLAGLGQAPQAAETSSAVNTLRWARGVVSGVTPEALILTLRDQSLTIALDASTITASAPVVGAIVEAHYTDVKHVRRAVIIFPDASGAAELTRKPGRSYRGVANGTRRSTLKIDIGQKNREVQLDKRTRLLDAEGKTVATGKNDLVPLLVAGERVLVKYLEEDDSMMAGDIFIPGSRATAVEVRRLK